MHVVRGIASVRAAFPAEGWRTRLRTLDGAGGGVFERGAVPTVERRSEAGDRVRGVFAWHVYYQGCPPPGRIDQPAVRLAHQTACGLLGRKGRGPKGRGSCWAEAHPIDAQSDRAREAHQKEEVAVVSGVDPKTLEKIGQR